MPNRYLRQSYIESESVSSLSWQAEVTWTHLIVTVDDWGRCEANIKLLRPRLFPLRLEKVREADLQRWLAECEQAGLLRRYELNRKEYLQMSKWERGRAEKSKYPEPPPDVDKCLQPQTSVNNGLQPKTFPPTPTPTPTPTPLTIGAGAREGLRTLPQSLDTPAFRQAWERWVIHWAESFKAGKPIPNATADSHLATCVKLGPTAAIEAIEVAIARHLREPAIPMNAMKAAPEPRLPDNLREDFDQ